MKNFKEKLNKAKTVYIMAAVSFCLAVIAIGVIYSQTMNTIEKNLTQISTTKQVNRTQENVTDPRKITSPSYKEKTTAEKIRTTLPSTTKAAEKPTAFYSENRNEQEPATQASSAAAAASVQSFIRPHDGEEIKPYSPEVPLYCETMNDWRTHNGIDIAVKEGDEVLSVGKGTVSRVAVDSNYGYTVEVDYGSFTARYCGMKQGECVSIGQSVEKGDSIGVVEAVPCEAKSAPHFHFEIIVDGEQVDPAKVLNW